MHKPTDEQAAIIEFARAEGQSVLVNALAGAAKTTTIEMICAALPTQPILCVAFNKRIQEEMEKRLPGHVRCQTLNSVGHRIWASTISNRMKVDAKKSYNLTQATISALRRSDQGAAWDMYSDISSAVRSAKQMGYIPEGKFPNGRRLVTFDEFWATAEEEPSDFLIDIVDTILTESITLGYKGLIDYDDQIYLPTLFGGSFPRFPLVMVDEAQDLSAINHALLDKLVTARLIAVGDPFQSIYGFRGAVANGMAKLQHRFSMAERGLSISFRCPIEIVKLARKRAPHMLYPDWAKPGEVHYHDFWSSKDIPDGSAIICRNNAPLFSAALKLLRAGRGVQLVGTDLGPGLVKVMKKLGPESMTREETLRAIDNWEAERLQKTRAKAAVRDRAECLRVFASFGSSLSAAIAYAETLFAARGPIYLLSGHKAKGLEWEVVYHLDPWRIPSQYAVSEEDLEQEKNVEYVITTRSKHTLHHADLETLDAEG